MRLENLSELQIDALREVGSIGSGHAATALSQLMGTPVRLAVPELEIIPIGEVPEVLGGPEQLVGAVFIRVLGDVEGAMLVMAQRDALLGLLDMLHDRTPGTTRSFGREQEAIVTHVASVLVAAYVAAIARLADANILPSQPSFVLDMAGAILEVATAEAGMKSTSALLVRTRFYHEDENDVEVALFFLPDQDSLEVILGRLGVA